MSTLLIEPIGNKPVRLVGKGLNAAIVLKPGEPQEIEAALGAKLLKQCSQTIRICRTQWTQAWQELVTMTEGIEEGHQMFHPLHTALNTCDQAFDQDDWPTFQRAVETVRQLTKDVVKPPKSTKRDEGIRPQLKPGDQVVYRTPRIRTPVDYDWIECPGTVHKIDDDRQMVLVIPKTEEQPRRWVAMCYVTKGTR